MEDKRNIYRNLFHLFFSNCIALLSFAFAIHAIYLTGGVKAMTTSFAPIVWVFIILALVCGIAGITCSLLMFRTPKDTRLDRLIDTVKKLQPDSNNIPNIDNLTREIDELKKLQTHLNIFFNKLSDVSKDNKPKE